jgi:hypothetical protein
VSKCLKNLYLVLVIQRTRVDINSRCSIPAVDAINTYYNHPDVPFAQNRSVTNNTAEPNINATANPVFVSTLANVFRFPEDMHDGSNTTIRAPLEFYHSILSKEGQEWDDPRHCVFEQPR